MSNWYSVIRLPKVKLERADEAKFLAQSSLADLTPSPLWNELWFTEPEESVLWYWSENRYVLVTSIILLVYLKVKYNSLQLPLYSKYDATTLGKMVFQNLFSSVLCIFLLRSIKI